MRVSSTLFMTTMKGSLVLYRMLLGKNKGRRSENPASGETQASHCCSAPSGGTVHIQHTSKLTTVSTFVIKDEGKTGVVSCISFI